MGFTGTSVLETTRVGGGERARHCIHCGQSVDAREVGDFCCTGCASVYALLHGEHLDRFYDLRGPAGWPVAAASRRRDDKWIDLLCERTAAEAAPSRIEVDIQGLHCSACVWLIEQLFRREPGAHHILVNPSLGRMVLNVGLTFALRSFVERVEAFGYALGPKAKDDTSKARGLLTRFGICVAITMNVMIFSIAMYAGLASGPLRRLFEGIDGALATLAVIVGGSVFFRSAWQGIRQRAPHLDLPIALGIAFAYAGSLQAYLVGRPPYFDTLCVFVTLMLLGRFLQQRVLEKNQRQLLGDAAMSSLLTRRCDQGVVRVVPCGDIDVGDELHMAAGDLVPVDAVLLEGRADCSLDWINGESRPRSFVAGQVIPAGAFNASPVPFTARATTPFAESPLTHILRTPLRGLSGTAGGPAGFLERLAPVYVAAVLGLGVLAFGVWLGISHDLNRAFSAATAMLVVTCPCALGIATPLAYELVLAGLRRRGLFVRTADFLDRASRVRRVVFDKTGTLTEGTMELSNPEPFGALKAEERGVLLALASASAHPKSEALASALQGDTTRDVSVTEIREVRSCGVEGVVGGRRYRLGSRSWAAPADKHEDGNVAFSRDGQLLAAFGMNEKLRPDAAREVLALGYRGYEVWLLSGDEAGRVAAAAQAIGIEPSRAIGGCRAEDKAAWLRTHDRQDTLMVGDGINDLYAVAAAFCSGTPAVDRPFVASRADFYFVSPGLLPIRVALSASRALARVVRRNLAVALAYNAVAVGLVLAGVMSPLTCAVLMPLSSLSTILATGMSLSERSFAWRS